MKTILVPVDFSAVTNRVCRLAADLAKATGGRLVLLHVVQLPPVIMSDVYAFDAGAMSGLLATAEKNSTRKLKALGRSLARRAGRVQTVHRTGLPVGTILKEAAARRAGTIVIGTHGHGAVYDLLVGSTTHGVLKKATCPVLVVPPVPLPRKKG